MPAKPEFQKRLESIEQMLRTIESAADPHLRATVQDLVETIMGLHGEGLERMLELIRATPDGEAALIPRLGRDELVGSLLILYGLHPVDLETRVGQGLDKARARLLTHDGQVELLGFEEGVVRLHLSANGHGCGSNAQALKEIIEETMYQSAPDLTTLVIEGAEEKQGFVPLEMLTGAGR
jgi:Fe-S cluster biogenesis protein NfuA